MRAPSIGTVLRLGRITALVAGCLLFLHACERTRRIVPTDVWLELVAAAVLGALALLAAWFEIVRAEHLEHVEELEAEHPPAPQPEDYRYATGGRRIRARIAKSGNLVIHGRDHDGPHPGHEWSWTFRPDTFPAVRGVLGGDGHVLDLLEEVVPRLDSDSRADPGAWLRAHGIPGTYREKGDHPSRTTHKLPILRPGARRPVPGREDTPPREPGARSGADARRRDNDPVEHRTRKERAGRARSGAIRDEPPTRRGPGSGPLPAATPSPSGRRRRPDADVVPPADRPARPDLPRRARTGPATTPPRPSRPRPEPAPGPFAARTGIDAENSTGVPSQPFPSQAYPSRSSSSQQYPSQPRPGQPYPSRVAPNRDRARHDVADAVATAPGDGADHRADPAPPRRRGHRYR
ncbi:hypothetical protein IU436_17660 [Nocardia farcinica]|uniref:hypothetical protein n=1 Tax=Nocardia farcinica TaxID=37329 RepID=UPI001895CC26|nr:hypothetical protein [Nocardia farcinica]MBF6417152.1 hypothetical protein [Nocardia farcinica]MBF6432183.1 hypothetical protein [Nocardia farcinica]MBF6502493.1 hypothetical protein [Nocardia farcinica]